MNQPQAQFEQVIPVAALPTVIGTAVTRTGDGNAAVLVSVHSPMGVHCFVLPPHIIDDNLIPQLRAAALQARTGLSLHVPSHGPLG